MQEQDHCSTDPEETVEAHPLDDVARDEARPGKSGDYQAARDRKAFLIGLLLAFGAFVLTVALWHPR